MKLAFGLEGQLALVVGGGFGIGEATAKLLAKAGARVAVADIELGRAEKVAREIGGYAVAGDVTTEAGAKTVVSEAREMLGGLTRVANIVGFGDFAEFKDTGQDLWDAQLRINLIHHMHVCHAARPHLVAAGGGAIAMLASVSGIYGARRHAAYGAAKAGVLSLARTLADEWGPDNIRVNTVAPDVIATPRLVDRFGLPAEEALAILDKSAARQRVPLGRFGRPEEIAGPLVFLLSGLASFMTGQCLVVDGGSMVHFPHAVSGET